MYDLQQYDLRVNEKGIPYLLKVKRLFSTSKKCNSPDDIYSVMKDSFDADKLFEECFWVMGLDNGNVVKAIFEISHGSINQTAASINSVMVRMLLSGAVKYG